MCLPGQIRHAANSPPELAARSQVRRVTGLTRRSCPKSPSSRESAAAILRRSVVSGVDQGALANTTVKSSHCKGGGLWVFSLPQVRVTGCQVLEKSPLRFVNFYFCERFAPCSVEEHMMLNLSDFSETFQCYLGTKHPIVIFKVLAINIRV